MFTCQENNLYLNMVIFQPLLFSTGHTVNANVCYTLYTSHLMFVHLGGLIDSNGMFNQKSCFHLYRCRGLICHTHVAPKFSHAQTRRQPWTGISGWPHNRTHTLAHPKTEWVQLLLINKWAALLADATVAIDSELSVQARGCLSNNQGCISISQFTEQSASSTRLIWHRGLARGSVCERARV